MAQPAHSGPCITFHQYGQRCSDLGPCRNCRHRLAEHGSEADGASTDPDYHKKLLSDIFKRVQSTDQAGHQPLLNLIRSGATFPEVRCYLDQVITGAPTPNNVLRGSAPGARLREGYEVESRVPTFRSKVMDVHYLCDSAPHKVPAKPWTSVTDDDALVSHLVSLYFTWDYPFFAFVDREILISHMQMGNLQSDFCNPLLVNALLANACVCSRLVWQSALICSTIRIIQSRILSLGMSRPRVRTFWPRRNTICRRFGLKRARSSGWRRCRRPCYYTNGMVATLYCSTDGQILDGGRRRQRLCDAQPGARDGREPGHH